MLLAGPNLYSSDGTEAKAAVGEIFEENGNTWMYVLASSDCAAYKLCLISKTFTVAPVDTTGAGSTVNAYCIPQFTIASGEYGWAPVGPFNVRTVPSGVTTFKVKCATLDAEGVKQYTTATAGTVDDSATTLVSGLTINATDGGGGSDIACRAVSRLVTV